jgi:plastocyanin
MLSKNARLWLGLIVGISLLSLASACSKGGDDGDNGPTTEKKAYTAKGNEGTVSGVVSYNGTAPEAKPIDTSADPACSKGGAIHTEEWAVKDGKVANSFVYIKDGTLADGSKLDAYSTWPNTPSSATLDQNGCHYKPHVIGVMVNEPISITNSDPTTHNVHFPQTKNPDWNQSQANGAPALQHKLARADVMIPVKCNQHPWMKSYVGVLNHPFFAVTAEDGSFTIKGVPPGKYTLVAWHEGGATGTEKPMQITVAANGTVKQDFAFGASAELLGQPGSLPMLEAITFPTLHNH